MSALKEPSLEGQIHTTVFTKQSGRFGKNYMYEDHWSTEKGNVQDCRVGSPWEIFGGRKRRPLLR